MRSVSLLPNEAIVEPVQQEMLPLLPENGWIAHSFAISISAIFVKF
jgi:hypothetical protein